MVCAAQTSCAGLRGVTIEQVGIEAFRSPPASLDLIITRLALHDVANLQTVLTTCAAALVSGGRLVLSVVHPLITANDADVPGQPRTSWPVDNYFDPGPRRRQWFDRTVTWQHRTIEYYVTALLHAGFTLTPAPAAHLLAATPAELGATPSSTALPASCRPAPLTLPSRDLQPVTVWLRETPTRVYGPSSRCMSGHRGSPNAPVQLEARAIAISSGGSGDFLIVEAEALVVHAVSGIVITDTDHIDPGAWNALIYSFCHYFGLGNQLRSSFRSATSRSSDHHEVWP